MANVKGTIVDAVSRAEVERRLDDIPMAKDGVFYQVRAKEKLYIGDLLKVSIRRRIGTQDQEAGFVAKHEMAEGGELRHDEGFRHYFRVAWREAEEGELLTFHAEGNTPDLLASVSAIVRSVGRLLGFDGEDLSGFALQMTEVCERGK